MAGMPFDLSSAITDISYAAAGPSNTSVSSCTGGYPPKSQCIGADTWYPSWSSGGDLFSTFTDGIAAGVDGSYAHPLSCGQCSRSPRPPSTWHNNGSSTDTGMVRVVGDTPSALSISDIQTVTSSALPYQGRYPSASFTYNGIWYVGTYAIAETWGRTTDEHNKPVPLNRQYLCGNWCVLGPFVGFHHAKITPRGVNMSWVVPRYEMAKSFASYNASSNLFSEQGPVCYGTIAKVYIGHAKYPYDYTCNGTWRGKVKMGTPHVVDLGRELEYAPQANGGGDTTKRVYLVADGAREEIDPYAPQTWMMGSETYLARTKVEPTPAVMDDGASWEFYAGAKGKWVDTVQDATPIWSWPNRTGSTTVTYIAPLKKFVMVVDAPGVKPQTPGQSMGGPFDTYFLEADAITGPYRMITYMPSFGPAAYFGNIPSKFVSSATTTDDRGRTVLECFLSYSQWGQLPGQPGRSDPPGSSCECGPRVHDCLESSAVRTKFSLNGGVPCMRHFRFVR